MKMKKVFTACALAAVMLSSTTAFAILQIPQVHDGLWIYGTTGKDGGGAVFSYYYKAGKSWWSTTVINAYGWTNSDSEWVPGVWARAKIAAVPNKIDRAYYNYG